MDKTASDAFYHTELHNVLQAWGIEKLVITGLQTEFCVDTTCRRALSQGYEVTLIADGHTTGDSHMKAAEVVEHHNRVLANLAHPHHNIAVTDLAEYVYN